MTSRILPLLAFAPLSAATFVPSTVVITFDGKNTTQSAYMAASAYDVSGFHVDPENNSWFMKGGSGWVANDPASDYFAMTGGSGITFTNTDPVFNRLRLNSLELSTSSLGPVHVAVWGFGENAYLPIGELDLYLSSPANFVSTGMQTYTFNTGAWTGSFSAIKVNVWASGNGVAVHLDNVSLTTAVPEPSTYGLALGAFALVGEVIRRRRKAA